MRSCIFFAPLLLILLPSCKNEPQQKTISQEAATSLTSNTTAKEYKVTGSIDRLDPAINQLISEDAVIEVLAGGFTWTEGPLWIADGDYLLFSDIPPNRIMKWSEDEGISLYLEPSGYTGSIERGGEPGSNGLLLDDQGRLVLCQHGDRQMARMVSDIADPYPVFQTIVGTYEGKRFNSPNDAVYDSQGNLYFTDPPYGLEGNMDDPAKEIDFQGVYRYSADEALTLIADDIPRPNGIGLSLDEKTLYVASSEHQPMWTSITLDDEGKSVEQQVFYDNEERDAPGAPDGLKVDREGNIWATGPGGVWIFNPDGKILGKIRTGQRTSNCAFNTDESVLYMTCDDYLMRIKL